MTPEEAAKSLRIGTVVVVNTWRKSKTYRARVIDSYSGFGGKSLHYVNVRPWGLTKNGKRRSSVQVSVEYLELPAESAPANVYADWLEENGFTEAATALREAFPLDDGVPEREDRQ